MTFKVVLSKQSSKYFAQLDVDTAKRVSSIFQLLEINSLPKGAKKLKGELSGFNRIRVGSLRIVYEVIMPENKIKIARIGPRGDIY